MTCIPFDLMKEDMEKMAFVNWDRFVVNDDTGGIDLYGWIKREDTHEDFVLITYTPVEKMNGWKTGYSTSSKLYDKQIFDILICDNKEPNPCQRVEEYFDVNNCIRLKEAINNDTKEEATTK